MWDCGAEPILQINTDYLTYDQQPEPKALEEQGLRGNVFYFEQYKEAWIKCKHSLWSTSNNNFIQFSQRRSNRSSWCSDQTHFSLIWIGDGCRGLAGTLRHVSNKNWAAQMLKTAHSIKLSLSNNFSQITILSKFTTLLQKSKNLIIPDGNVLILYFFLSQT